MKVLTESEARRLTDRIGRKLGDVLPMVREAWAGRADQALGYPSWTAYCAAEFHGFRIDFGDREKRRKASTTLFRDGMDKSSIADALGVNEKTVRRDIKDVESSNSANAEMDHPTVTSRGRVFMGGKDHGNSRRRDEPPACKPMVIDVEVKTSPIHYAREAARLLAEWDDEQYGPEHLTAEQIRVSEEWRAATQQFAIICERDELAKEASNEETSTHRAGNV